MYSFLFFSYVAFISYSAVEGDRDETKANAHHKGQLPQKISCDIRSTAISNRCYKGDLIDESIADCEKDYSLFGFFFSCDPIDDDFTITFVDRYFTTRVNVPDVNKHGVNCIPVSGKPVRCGSEDTRCVCDAPFDVTSPQKRSYFADINHCRCQYWPNTDIRASQPAVCKQYDHGGTSGIHFYACCNNCNDDDTSCDGETYQGGGTIDNLCGTCGDRIPSEQSSRHTYTFNCDSCVQQRQCKDYCNNQHPYAKSIPGLCPKWVGCFRSCCHSITSSSRGKAFTAGNQIPFCGDNICSDQETSDTCPSDCCPTVNPKDCPSDQCSDCCMEATCCITSSSTAGSAVIIVAIITVLHTGMYIYRQRIQNLLARYN